MNTADTLETSRTINIVVNNVFSVLIAFPSNSVHYLIQINITNIIKLCLVPRNLLKLLGN